MQGSTQNLKFLKFLKLLIGNLFLNSAKKKRPFDLSGFNWYSFVASVSQFGRAVLAIRRRRILYLRCQHIEISRWELCKMWHLNRFSVFDWSKSCRRTGEERGRLSRWVLRELLPQFLNSVEPWWNVFNVVEIAFDEVAVGIIFWRG